MAATSSDHSPTANGRRRPCVRVAAVADVHGRADRAVPAVEALGGLAGEADLLLVAGDLTSHGTPDEAERLAEICGGLGIPVFAVLGNHDWHCDRADEVVDVLGGAGVTVLDREASVCTVNGIEVGVAGAKGFIGGFEGSRLPDFGEPTLRALYREAGAEAAGLEAALREIAVCPLRLVVLHYSPLSETLVGEREGIWAFLGSDRLAAPILEHEPDLVVHGHAHGGTFAGQIGEVEAFNVSVPVIARDDRPYWLFELEPAHAADSAIR